MAEHDTNGPPSVAGQSHINLAEGSKPTPTQEENDLAAVGENVLNKEPDGSPLDPGVYYPPEIPDFPGPQPPFIESINPTSGPLPDVNLQVDGHSFKDDAVVIFDGAAQPTTFVASTRLTASIVGFAGAAGSYDVLVRGEAGDSNVKPFTFTGAEEVSASGRRRR